MYLILRWCGVFLASELQSYSFTLRMIFTPILRPHERVPPGLDSSSSAYSLSDLDFFVSSLVLSPALPLLLFFQLCRQQAFTDRHAFLISGMQISSGRSGCAWPYMCRRSTSLWLIGPTRSEAQRAHLLAAGLTTTTGLPGAWNSLSSWAGTSWMDCKGGWEATGRNMTAEDHTWQMKWRNRSSFVQPHIQEEPMWLFHLPWPWGLKSPTWE